MFNSQILIRSMVVSCLLLTACGVAAAQGNVIARVLATEGKVEIRREASGRIRVQNVAFKVEDQVFSGDTIITGSDGRLVVGLSDGSQAVIAPKTTVILKDLSNTPRTLFEVIKGKTRIQIEKHGGQPNPYRVNTPTAVIAVRGTTFDVVVEGEETQVYLTEGEVAVTNLVEPNRPVFLLTGQMTRVGSRGGPIAPGIFKIGRNDLLFKVGRIGQLRIGTQEAGRIADRGGPPSNGGTRPDPGRGAPPPPKGPRPAGGSAGQGKRP